MKFTDLVFDQEGCCGTHKWAVARHENGIRTDVYECESGYRAATFSGTTLMVGLTELPDAAAVDARLASDSALFP